MFWIRLLRGALPAGGHLLRAPPDAAHLAEAGGNCLKELDADGFPVVSLPIAPADEVDRRAHAAFRREIREPDIQKLIDVRLEERGALDRRDEHRGVYALSAVIDGRVVIGVIRRERGIARAEARPDLRADPRPVAVPVDVAHVPGKRRQNPHVEVVFSRAVLGDHRAHKGVPVFRKHRGVQPAPLVLGGAQPHQLQIHVVVGDGVGDILHKSVHVVDAAVAFKGRPQGAADVLSQIAPLYLAVISLKIHVHVLPR